MNIVPRFDKPCIRKEILYYLKDKARLILSTIHLEERVLLLRG
jgi:hypothetical protein